MCLMINKILSALRGYLSLFLTTDSFVPDAARSSDTEVARSAIFRLTIKSELGSIHSYSEINCVVNERESKKQIRAK